MQFNFVLDFEEAGILAAALSDYISTRERYLNAAAPEDKVVWAQVIESARRLAFRLSEARQDALDE